MASPAGSVTMGLPKMPSRVSSAIFASTAARWAASRQKMTEMIVGIRSRYSTHLHYDAYLHLDGLTDAEVCGALSRLG